jgi:hypothetical protein
MGFGPRRAVLRGAIVLAALPLVAGACSDDDDGDESARACDARTELSSSVEALGEVDVAADGTDGLRRAFDDVVAAVDELAEATGDRLEDETDAVRAEVDDVQTAVGGIGDQSAAASVELVGAEVGELTESASALVDEASSTCG